MTVLETLECALINLKNARRLPAMLELAEHQLEAVRTALEADKGGYNEVGDEDQRRVEECNSTNASGQARSTPTPDTQG